MALLFALGAAAWWSRSPSEPSEPTGSVGARRPFARRAEDRRIEPPLELASPRCAHPYLPQHVGEWRRYTARRGGGETPATITIELAGERSAAAPPDVLLEWSYEMRAQGSAATTTTRGRSLCDPAGGAEDPFFALLSRLMQVPPTRMGWRVPRVLEAGLVIEGEARFEPIGGGDALVVRREEIVAGSETVETPAGAFSTWRLEATDTNRLGDAETTYTRTSSWAPGVGVVRQTERAGPRLIYEIELVARGRRR